MWGGIAELDLWLRAHAEVTQLMAGDTAEDKGSMQTHTFLSLCFTSEIFYQVKQTFNSRNNIKNYSSRALLPLQRSSKLPASQIKCAPQILMFNIYLARALCSFYQSGKLVTVGWKEKHLKSLTALIYPQKLSPFNLWAGIPAKKRETSLQLWVWAWKNDCAAREWGGGTENPVGSEMHTGAVVLSLQLYLNYSSDILLNYPSDIFLHSPKPFKSRNTAGTCQVRIESRAALSEGGQEQKNPIV